MNEDEMLCHVAQSFCENKEVVGHGLFLVSMIDLDGQAKYGWKTIGEPNISETVGLLELVKHQVVLRTYEGFDDAP